MLWPGPLSYIRSPPPPSSLHCSMEKSISLTCFVRCCSSGTFTFPLCSIDTYYAATAVVTTFAVTLINTGCVVKKMEWWWSLVTLCSKKRKAKLFSEDFFVHSNLMSNQSIMVVKMIDKKLYSRLFPLRTLGPRWLVKKKRLHCFCFVGCSIEKQKNVISFV